MGTKHFDKLKPEPGPTLGKLQLASCKFEQSGRVCSNLHKRTSFQFGKYTTRGGPSRCGAQCKT